MSNQQGSSQTWSKDNQNTATYQNNSNSQNTNDYLFSRPKQPTQNQNFSQNVASNMSSKDRITAANQSHMKVNQSQSNLCSNPPVQQRSGNYPQQEPVFGGAQNESNSFPHPPIQQHQSINQPPITFVGGQNALPFQEPKKPVIAEISEFCINDPIINKINCYLIGYKDDNEAYFNKIKENFKFLKEIPTSFKFDKFKKDILSDNVSFEKPNLAITLSPDYLGRVPDKWNDLTKFIYDQTGKNKK